MRGQLIIGLENLWVATPEQRQELIWKMSRHRPHKTEGEVLEELSKMSSGDLYLMLINRHPAFEELGLGGRRRGGGHSYDYDALPYGQAETYGPLPIGIDHGGQDNWGREMPRPQASSRPLVSRRRNWYDHN